MGWRGKRGRERERGIKSGSESEGERAVGKESGRERVGERVRAVERNRDWESRIERGREKETQRAGWRGKRAREREGKTAR